MKLPRRVSQLRKLRMETATGLAMVETAEKVDLAADEVHGSSLPNWEASTDKGSDGQAADGHFAAVHVFPSDMADNLQSVTLDDGPSEVFTP